MMGSILLCTLLAVGAAPDHRTAPLTHTQITKLQQVVRQTLDHHTKSKEGLDDRQQALMKAYSQFELDEQRISKLHEEIVDLQRELLDNYRALQVELRAIVGQERFLQLKKRIDLMLNKKKTEQTPAGTKAAGSGKGVRPQ
jgi:cobalamin biosynthesis Mg chelatase CobN